MVNGSSWTSCKMFVNRLRPSCSGNWGKKGNIQLALSTSFYAIVPRCYGEMRPLAVTQTYRVQLNSKRDKRQMKQDIWLVSNAVSGLRLLHQRYFCFEEIPNRRVRNVLSTEQAEILNWSVFYFSLDVHLAYRKMRVCWGRGKQCHVTQKAAELFASFVFVGIPAIKGGWTCREADFWERP